MTDELKPETTPEPEPEGLIEVEISGQKQKVATGSVIAAERNRVREKTEAKFKGEIDALKVKAARADQLEADLGAVRPHVEYLQQNPHLMKRDEAPELQKVSDEEAERFARQYELYGPSGLDLGRAKRIIADQHATIKRVATEAAQEAVGPIKQGTHVQQARQNFAWAAQQRGPDGRPLVDPTVLSQVFAYAIQQNPEYAADPTNAAALLRVAIGEQVMSGKTVPAAPIHEPLFSEAPGGRRGGEYQISEVEKRMASVTGVSEADWAKRAQGYQPDADNVLGD